MASNPIPAPLGANEFITRAQFNQFLAALQGVIVGRGIDGVPISGIDLGTVNLPFGTVFANSLQVGGSVLNPSELALLGDYATAQGLIKKVTKYPRDLPDNYVSGSEITLNIRPETRAIIVYAHQAIKSSVVTYKAKVVALNSSAASISVISSKSAINLEMTAYIPRQDSLKIQLYSPVSKLFSYYDAITSSVVYWSDATGNCKIKNDNKILAKRNGVTISGIVIKDSDNNILAQCIDSGNGQQYSGASLSPTSWGNCANGYSTFSITNSGTRAANNPGGTKIEADVTGFALGNLFPTRFIGFNNFANGIYEDEPKSIGNDEFAEVQIIEL